MEKYYKLCEFLEKELDEIVDTMEDGAHLEASDLHNIKNLVCSIKDIEEIIEIKHYKGGRY